MSGGQSTTVTVKLTVVAVESAVPATEVANNIPEYSPSGKPKTTAKAVPLAIAGSWSVPVEISTVCPNELWMTAKTIPVMLPLLRFV